MNIFLSYSSRQQTLAEQLYLELEHSGHCVFFDKKSLKAGGDFRKRIRSELDQTEVFIFLISPSSVAIKSYARTELEIAREKWPQPEGHILPVMATATDLDSVPPYLKAVTILNPEGEIVEAVSRCLDDWSPMEEVDPVKEALAILKQKGVPPAVAGLIALGVALGSFEQEVLDRGTANKIYSRRLKGIIKGQGSNARLVQEPTDYMASAGREFRDNQGRTCREVNVTFQREGKWITHRNIFFLDHGRWVKDQTG